MNLVSIRSITADVQRLVKLYAELTGTALTLFTEDFAELKTPSGTLAIGCTRTLQLFGGDIARAADNHSAIIEFRVAVVVVVYRKIVDIIGFGLVLVSSLLPW